MHEELGDVLLRSVKPPVAGKRLEIWDKRSCLVMQITAADTRTWYARQWIDGRRTWIRLGTYPAIGLSDARKLAGAAATDAQRGINPVAERRAKTAARLARTSLPTVANRLDQWREAKTPVWSHRYQSEVLRLCIVEIIPTLGARPLIETTRSDWTDVIAAKHREAPGVGVMLYRTVAAFLTHAETLGWIPATPLPRKGMAVIAPPVAARQRALTDEELRAVWLAADRLSSKARCFVHLLVMTACRKREAADIPTGEIDLAAGLWRLPDGRKNGRRLPDARTKNGNGITLPLHPLVLDDIRAVWPQHNAGPKWRLLGDVPGGGLRGFSTLKTKLDAACGVTGWRLHDLRRTARTGLTRLGVSRDHSEACLNHISARTTLDRTYDTHDFGAEVLAALQRWQAHVASLMTDQPSADVVPLHGAA